MKRRQSASDFYLPGREVKPIVGKTTMRIIPTMVGPEVDQMVDMPARPSLEWLRNLILPHLEGMQMEHVAVLYGMERRDMFVGEDSAARCIRNLRATEIYWENARTRIRNDPASAANFPEPWPAVCGPAILFPDRQVWF